MQIEQILTQAVQSDASDIFFVTGFPISYKIGGLIRPQGEGKLLPAQTDELVDQLYRLAGQRIRSRLEKEGEDDFSFSLKGIGRFRVNVYMQRGSFSAVLRVVRFSLPDPAAMGIPPIVTGLSRKNKGLVLITGAAGSGKSTTLACIIDRINHERNGHIITIEDPIEFLHRHDKCIVSQREVASDTGSYIQALRAALRQSPNVILLGEMRDLETIGVAMTAAETGQLVLSTLHTIGAANTVDRIVDVFPAAQQQQIRVQLSMVLEAVVSQQLIPSTDGGLVPAFEIMLVNSAIRTLIRDGKTHQIDNVIYSSAGEGMVGMDASILELFAAGKITDQNALQYAVNPEMMAKRIALAKQR